jgi:hypothetical protein
MNFTIEFVNEENKRMHDSFYKKYKTDKARMKQSAEQYRMSETVRGLYIMEKWHREGRNGNPVAMLKHYSLGTDVMSSFIKTYLSTVVSDEQAEDSKPEKRKDKWGAFDKWTTEHTGEQFSTDQLVEIAGFSYQTTLKYVSESPLFIKIKKGLWQVADVQRKK